MLDVEDVFRAVRDVISKEALAEAGDLGIVRRRKRRKKVQPVVAAPSPGASKEVDEKLGANAATGAQAALSPK